MKKEKSGINLKQFKKFLKAEYGDKCKDFEPTCIVCVVWRLYSDLDKLVNVKWIKI